IRPSATFPPGGKDPSDVDLCGSAALRIVSPLRPHGKTADAPYSKLGRVLQVGGRLPYPARFAHVNTYRSVAGEEPGVGEQRVVVYLGCVSFAARRGF
ncbi:MAG: hypothetical protein ACKOFW_05020, partial [Planctomycetaceae bacterium]